MFKYTLSIALWITIFNLSYAQNIVIKQVATATAKFDEAGHTIVALSKELQLDTTVTEVFFMVGFEEAQSPKKNIRVYLEENSKNKIFYQEIEQQKGKNFGILSTIGKFIDHPIKIKLSASDIRDTLYIKIASNLFKLPITNINKKKERITPEKPIDKKTDIVSPPTDTTNNPQLPDIEEINDNNDWIILLLITALFSVLLTFLITKTMFKRKYDAIIEMIKKKKSVISDKEKEEIQLKLLKILEGKGVKENYSFEVQAKLKKVKSILLSAQQSKNWASEKEKMQQKIKNLTTKANNKQKIATRTGYPKYYIVFHEKLNDIFQNLMVIRKKMKPDSIFIELLDKVLYIPSNKQIHPLLQFASRDEFVLEKLELSSRKELQNIDASIFFKKYVYWQCSSLINNLSKLYAYSKFNDSELALQEELQKDKLDALLLEQTFHDLQELLATTFDKKLTIPILGSQQINEMVTDRVDYNFIKSKFFDKLPKIEPGTIYDFNKVIILNQADGSVFQKGQVSVKK